MDFNKILNNNLDGFVSAIKFNLQDTHKQALEEGCDYDGKYNEYNRVPVCVALTNRDLELFAKLVELGADPYTNDSNGYNAYMHLLACYTEFSLTANYTPEQVLKYINKKYKYEVTDEYLNFINSLLLEKKDVLSLYKEEYKDKSTIYGLSTLYYSIITDNVEVFKLTYTEEALQHKDNYEYTVMDYLKVTPTPNIDLYLSELGLTIEKLI